MPFRPLAPAVPHQPVACGPAGLRRNARFPSASWYFPVSAAMTREHAHPACLRGISRDAHAFRDTRERLFEARERRAHDAGADLADARLLVRNAGVDHRSLARL